MKKEPEHTCRRCGKCCLADFIAYAATEDQQRWRDEGRQDILDVIEREHAIWMGDHLVSSQDGHYLRGCPFLAWEEDHSCCTIYETRPQICRNYQPGSSEICSQFKSYQPSFPGKDRTGKESTMGRCVKKITALLIVVTVSCLWLAPDARAFRCGDEIVGTGDSKAKVLIKCGKPTYQEKVGAKKSTRVKGQKSVSGEKQISHGAGQTMTKSMEKWTYNCGKNDFIYVLTLEGGIVIQEETLGRGRGASECLGR